MGDADAFVNDGGGGAPAAAADRVSVTSIGSKNRRNDDDCCLAKRSCKICLRVTLVLAILLLLFVSGVLIW